MSENLLAVALWILLPAMCVAQDDRCNLLPNQHIYSNAQYIEEAGDVIGYEIVLTADGKNVLLFIYEGALTDPIVLPASYHKGEVTVSADYSEPLFQGSDRQRILEKHHIALKVHASDRVLAGTVTFDDNPPEDLRLHRVSHIWGCKARSS